jgi:hypothetical protein
VFSLSYYCWVYANLTFYNPNGSFNHCAFVLFVLTRFSAAYVLAAIEISFFFYLFYFFYYVWCPFYIRYKLESFLKRQYLNFLNGRIPFTLFSYSLFFFPTLIAYILEFEIIFAIINLCLAFFILFYSLYNFYLYFFFLNIFLLNFFFYHILYL